ncbi:MAG TPA: hypothetical protein VJ986_04845 [Gaiellaceae bacterium]|nr:hypothetical protein [Gaiellaceae bacterium]
MSMFAITVHNGIRIAELGEALGAIGGGLLVLGAMTPFGRKAGTFLGGLGIAGGFVLLIIATRWGHFG